MKKSSSSYTDHKRFIFNRKFLAPSIVLVGILLVIGVSLPIRFLRAYSVPPAVSLTTLGSAYTQNFDTLSNTAGSTTNTLAINGWTMTESGGGARDNEQYAVDTGGSNTGDTYSYGAAAVTDRALGALRSGTLIPIFGAAFTNNTGATITSLDVAYTGEEWRLGTAARTDQINFEYSTNATDLVTGTWTGVTALNFVTPDTVTTGAKNGNAAGERTALSSTITGLSIANGATFWIRWTDTDATGADDGLSVDDFSLTPQGAGGGMPNLSINDVSLNEGNAGTTTYTFTVSLSAPAGAGGVTFDIATADGTAQDDNPATEDNDYVAKSLTAQTIPMGSSTYTFDVLVNGDTAPETNETFFVNVTNVTNAIATDGQGQGTILNEDFTPIHTIQGSGDMTPIPGTTVTTTGIVTLLKTGSNAGSGVANGFFLQTPDANADADPNTSQGIFVFTSVVPVYTSSGTPVAVGDEVSVTGTVAEFNGLTEISPTTNIAFIDAGNPLPTPVTLNATLLDAMALPTQPQLEKHEAMRLAAVALLTVVPNDNFFDVDTVLSTVPRQQVFREPGIAISATVPPDPTSGTPDPNVPRWDENPERLKVDTNGRAGAPNTPYTSNVTFSNVAGPLDFAFGEYRLVLDASPTASANLSAVAIPVPLTDEFTIAGYNIENFNNNATQREKVSLTFRTILRYPDIVGVAEIFDLADLQALRDEINNDAVAAGDPNPLYQAFLIEQDGVSEDNDQDVGFLVKTSRVSVTSVTQERQAETFINPINGMPETLHDRPPLVLDAIVDPSGTSPQRVLVVVNHLRSFIDIEQDPGDGPRVRAKRTKQAESLAGLLQELQTNNPTTPIVSVGDYNAFQFSDGYTDPISIIKGNPTPDDQVVVDQSPDLVTPDFINLIDGLPADQKYTFVFEGTPQVLDHVLINTVAQTLNTRISVARNNADFPGSPASAFETDITRTERNSDHDMPVAYFRLLQPCIVTCPANVTVANDTGQCGAVVNYPNPTTSGDCGTVTCSPASGTFFAVGTTTVTCTDQPGGGTKVTPAGATGTCSFTVTVNDTQAPTITCPANITRTEQKPGQGAVVNYADPTVMDNCSGATFSCAPPSGSTFPVGTTTVTCTATDAANNMTPCTFTVTVNAANNCVLTCPANITVPNDQGQCGAVVTYSAPTTTGDCGTVTCSPASGSLFPVGTTTVTCTATKGATCTFTVTVNSTQPALTCPANITVSNDQGQCGAVVNYPAPVVNPCTKATVVCSPASGSFFATGTTTVTCTATDGGRKETCTFTVRVNDTQAPTLTCPANKTASTDANLCTAVVTYANPTATDNCPNVGAPLCSPVSGSTFPKGVTTVTCTVSDASGNTASCSFTVTVNDTQAPTITCPVSKTVVTTNPAMTSAVVTYTPPTVTDNCPGATVVCSPASGATFPLGATTVTCTATDTSGNTASCSFTVTVFNLCLQDDNNSSTVVLANTQTGDYIFCCAGSVFKGKGIVAVSGSTYTIQHNTTERRVLIKLSATTNNGTASLQTPVGTPRCAISDRDIRNNTCNCQ